MLLESSETAPILMRTTWALHRFSDAPTANA